MKPFLISKPYLLSQKRALIVYVLIILATAAISILSPYIVGSFLDNLIEGADISVILRFCAVFGGLSLIRIVKGYVTAIMYTRMQTKMSYDFNMDTIRHIQGLSLSYTSGKDSAYLSQRVGSDTGGLIVFCISILQSIITNVIMLIVPFTILLAMNWFIAVLMMGFLVIYTSLYFAFKKPLYDAGFAFREAQAMLFSKLYEQLKYIKIIKLNSTQSEMNRRADGSFGNYRQTAIHSQKVNYLYSGLDGFVSTLAQIALFVIGGIQILAGNFTIGMFTIFISYFNMMLGASRYFFGLGASYQNVLVSYDRIKEIFDQKPESSGLRIINDISRIELRDVGFTYAADKPEARDDGPKKAVHRFNASFTKGRIYAISGQNGAGKSTLINLMMGLYIDEYEGSITYDGVDIRDINMVAARKIVLGIAEQEPQLVSDSIWYNLSFGVGVGNDKCTKSIEEHAEILNMTDFISQKTLDFEIDEKNTNTSGGEKQKISILRNLHKNPAVMIFDEPTSALDAKTTEKFVAYLRQIKKEKIIIMITHDEVVKKLCDEIVEFDKYGI